MQCTTILYMSNTFILSPSLLEVQGILWYWVYPPVKLSHSFRWHQSVQFERKVTVECCHSACAHLTTVIHLHVESCMHATWIAVRLVMRSTHPHRHHSLFVHVIFRISDSRWWLLRKCLGAFRDLHYWTRLLEATGYREREKKFLWNILIPNVTG